MKRRFTFLLAAVFLLMSGLAWGQTRTTVTDVLNRESTGVTSTSYASWSGVTSNSDAVYAGQSAGGNNSIQLRSNNSNSGIITTASGGTVTNVIVSWHSATTNGRTLNIYGKDSAYNSPSDLYNASSQGTLIGTIVCGTSTSLDISDQYAYIGMRSASGAMYLEEIDITWSTGGSQQNVATPTFTPAAGIYYEAQNVTISTTTEGAAIHYTLDGTTPTVNSPVYSTPLAISQTTTVKAMAVKSGMNNSNVATATYTIQEAPSVITIAAARALELNEYALVQGVVTFIDGRNVYVQDETAGIDLYLNSAVSTLALGDKVQAYGKRANYSGLIELSDINPTDASKFSVLSTGNPLPLAVKTIAEILADHQNGDALQSTRVQIVEATVDSINNNTNSVISQGENSFNIYKMPVVEGLLKGDIVTVIGVISCFSNNAQLRVASADDITFTHPQQETVATPTFSPAAGTYTGAINVELACGTEGATIYYTTNGDDPIAPTGGPQGSVYSSPITISETTTLKAVAVKQGLYNSAMATAIYTIEAGPSLITIAEARALELNEYALVQGIVTFIDGKNVYVQDETAGIDLFLNANAPATLSLGDKVQGYGKKAVYKGLIELSGINGNDTTKFKVISTGNTLPLAVKTIAEINTDAAGTNMLQSTRVQIVEATVDSINNNNNTLISQGENSFNIYKMPVVEGLLKGDIVTVIGIIGCYNAPQLRVASANDVTYTHPVVETVATPTFSPEGGDFTEVVELTISCATDSATIYYTLDGSDPVYPTKSVGYFTFEYTEPIILEDTTTVKAIAIKQGLTDSEIATAVYNIDTTTTPIPIPEPTDYTLITHNNALISGDKYIVVGIKSEGYKALGKQATNNRVAEDVTPVDNVVTLTPATTNEGGVFELTLGQSGDNWTLYDAVNQGYLYAASSSANQLKVQAENDANGQWTIDIASDGVATIKAQGGNTRNWLRLNNSGTPFSCYASGQMDVYLYKAGDIPEPPTPPTPTQYTVSIANGIENGEVYVSDTLAYEGDTIYVTTSPYNNFDLTALTYSYTGATPADIMETGMFIMPAANVIVNATFTEIVPDAVATPTFTPAAGTYITAQTVSIACDTIGATIYYTLDGTTPTINSTEYTEPFMVTSTTTVKAMAVREDLSNSAIASVTYTIVEQTTIAEARALETSEYALVQGVVTFIDGRNVYVQDETAGIDLFLNNNTVPDTLAIGDMVLAYGKKAVYNGLVELSGINGSNDNQFVILSNNNELPLAEVTIAEILEDAAGDNMLQATRVQIVDATMGTINTSGNTPITQNGSTLNIYRMPVVEGLEVDDIVTVIGIIGCYNAVQLRVVNAEDVEFFHPAMLTASPTSLSGFTYVYDEGPSNIKTFTLTGRHLGYAAHIYGCEYFEISSFPEGSFHAENHISISHYSGNFSFPIQVRLKADLEIGEYEDQIMICQAELDTLYINLVGVVTEQAMPSSDYVRITSLEQLTSGSKVIFAARYNDVANEYYAMKAQTSGKPEGVLFTSVEGTDAETLPGTITDEEAIYYWTVETNGTTYTFTNAEGAVIGYTNSTNFATGGDNTAWTITAATSEATAMVPEYSAFVIANGNVTNRAFALNSNHNYGAYHTQNMAADNYNFFIDMFVSTEGGSTPTCAAPTFDPEGGVYFDTQTVTISCTTADATIYYTLDGNDPDSNSMVYTEPIEVAENMTIKAIAMKEGFNNSNVAEAEYTIVLGAVTIFYQDWEGEMNGWTFVTVEGNKPWTIGTYGGNHFADANGYNDTEANEQWCISPAFNLDNYENVSLSFKNAMKFIGPDMEVYFSNNYDGEDPSAAGWFGLEYVKSEGNFVWAESGMISLADLEGSNCYIGFRYLSNPEEGAAHWEVDDISLVGFTGDPVLTVTPTSLTGFSYVEGNGPSAEQSFHISGVNMTDDLIVSIEGDAFEMSSESGEAFDHTDEYQVEPYEGIIDETIYVRMVADLEVGDYTGTITVTAGDDVFTVTLEGTVTEPVVGGEWNRIGSLADLHDGDQVVIAARYDAAESNGYYAMTATASGKPVGVLFTSVTENGAEMLPDEIASNANTYLWNVTVDGNVITLTNADGNMLGYSTSTNFAPNTNTEWTIDFGTSGENAMVPNYSGFLINNATTTNRYIAENSNHNYGAYAGSNMGSSEYNFFLDLFVLGGTATQVVATPMFSMASGTYYDEFDVEITCATEGATIYYTTDGSNPTDESSVYEEAIHVNTDMTIKAIAMMEGYENSGIATANYELILGMTIIFNQTWEGEMDGWTFVNMAGNKPWTISEHSGNHYAYANSYTDTVPNEQWCISPAFDLSGYTQATLTFKNAKNYNGPDLELLFSTDYNGEDPTEANWLPIEFNMSTGGFVWAESGEIVLDELRSDNCYIAFRYIGSPDEGAAAWEVDDILLYASVDDAVSEMETMDVNFWNYSNEIVVENNTNGNLHMMVYDLLGQQVFAKTINAGVVRFSHNLADGLYVVTLQNSKGRTSVKMVVR